MVGRLGINVIGLALDALIHLRKPCKHQLSREAAPTRHAWWINISIYGFNFWLQVKYFNSSEMATPDIGNLDISDSDTEDLFASPSRVTKPAHKPNAKTPELNTTTAPQRNGESKYE